MKRTRINPISKKRRQILKEEEKIRMDLLEKCQGLCMECGKFPDWRGLSLHHKKFKSHGGGNSDGNVMLVCGKCHSSFHGIVEK
jgi:5-methylcytosine-specific restriction endonuclease McrA